MKKIILASLVVILSGCSSYHINNEALTAGEHNNMHGYCYEGKGGSIVWKNNVAYCDNGGHQYPIPKNTYKESEVSFFH